MILVDSSVWVEHLRSGDAELAAALADGLVLGHRWVIGELALGGASPEVQQLIGQLPQAEHASDDEVMVLISSAVLAGRGIGWVDAALLASARLTPGARLRTRDRRLRAAAKALSIAA